VLELPAQKELLPLIDGVGAEYTVVVVEVEPVHPFAFVTVTVNVAAKLTLML
jgi:hypothetical protein